MRYVLFAISLCGLSALLIQDAHSQEKEIRRFGVIANLEFYPQSTPRETVKSLLKAWDRDRQDYVAAHLLSQKFVDEQLGYTKLYFEQEAKKRIEAGGEKLTEAQIQRRIRDIAEPLNQDYFVSRIKKKYREDPEILRRLRLIAEEGEFSEQGDKATATHKDFKKEATLHFSKIGDRWFLENKTEP